MTFSRRRNVAHTKISITFRVGLDHKSSSLSLSLSLSLSIKVPYRERLSAAPVYRETVPLCFMYYISRARHSLAIGATMDSLLDARVITRRICFASVLAERSENPPRSVESRYTSSRSSQFANHRSRTGKSYVSVRIRPKFSTRPEEANFH